MHFLYYDLGIYQLTVKLNFKIFQYRNSRPPSGRKHSMDSTSSEDRRRRRRVSALSISQVNDCLQWGQHNTASHQTSWFLSGKVHYNTYRSSHRKMIDLHKCKLHVLCTIVCIECLVKICQSKQYYLSDWSRRKYYRTDKVMLNNLSMKIIHICL